MMGQTPQQCFMMPILVGTDGVQKMSKSLDNYVALEEPPQDMYGKLMSLPDSLITSYYEYLTDVPDADIAEMRQAMESETANPMDFKKGLAHRITTTFHDAQAASAAEAHFEQVVQRRDLPDDMPEVSAADIREQLIGRVLVQTGLAASNSEARRLVSQGAVEIIRADGQRESVAAGEMPALKSRRRGSSRPAAVCACGGVATSSSHLSFVDRFPHLHHHGVRSPHDEAAYHDYYQKKPHRRRSAGNSRRRYAARTDPRRAY